MYQEINKQITTSSRVILPQASMSVNEARERLNEEFGDIVSVHKAF